MPSHRFRVVLEGVEGMNAAVLVPPFDVKEAFGTRGRVPVRGTIAGAPFRSTLVPMGGRHMMPVNRELREAAGVAAGDEVEVVLERDTEERTVEAPEDLARALAASPAAQATWDGLSYTHRKEWARHVEEAKRPETRARRIEKAVATLAAGKRQGV
jgi:hypothetical protein